MQVVSTAANSIMSFGYGIVLMYCIGDYDAVSTSPLPIVEIYFQATKSKASAMVLVILLHTFMIFIGTVNILASVTRLVWSFARDKGLPFHTLFTSVSVREI